MPAHQPILPAKAIELVKSRNLDGADALLADFAAAGLIKTYALVREIRPTGGPTETIRDGQVPPGEWGRIVASDNVCAALNGGTVRLEGSTTLQGGTPSVLITGISFSEASLVKILDRYCANSPASFSKQPTASSAAAVTSTNSSSQTCEPRKRDVPPIRPGDLTASVAQAEQATGLGRTTIDKLMRDGTLHRKKAGRRTLITVESIERLVGAKLTQ